MLEDKPKNYDHNYPHGKLYIEDKEEYVAPVDIVENNENNNGDISPAHLNENYEQIDLDDWENYCENSILHSDNRQSPQSHMNIDPTTTIANIPYKKHENVQKHQDIFNNPDFNLLAGEYDRFSSNIDKKLKKLGAIGIILIFLKKIVFSILAVFGLVLAAILLCVFMIGYGVVLIFGGIIGTIYFSIIGTFAFILNRIVSFIVVTAVLIVGFNYFWKMNPELSGMVDEYKQKANMYYQKYIGGFSLPEINTFDDIVESSLDAVGLTGADIKSVKNLKIPSINTSNFGEITPSMSIKDLLPKEIIKRAIPSELAPIIDATGDPESVAIIADLLSGGIAPQKLDKTAPVLKEILMTTKSNDIRAAVLKSLKNINTPNTKKIIKEYEILINRSIGDFGIK